MPTKEIDVMHLAGLIALIGLPFSKSKNALFGPYHVAAILAHMVRNGVCANAAIASFWAEAGKDPHKEIKRRDRRKVRFPTDQWLFRLFGSISPEEMEERCDLMLDAQMKIMRGAGIMNDAVIDIVDVHNVPHYGKKKDKHVVRTKHKNGTGKAESYATLLTTSGGYPYCTAITRLFAKRTKADIVAKLLDGRARRGIGALITMLDRGFFTVAVMQAFADRGLHFVMGAVRTAAVKKALDEYIAGTRKAISECTIRSGKKSFTFTLCIVEKTEVKKGKEKKVYVLYATNLPDAVVHAPGFDIDELYGKRWDIESNYRKVEEVRLRTVSRDHSARTFFFFMSPVFLNMWAAYNQREKAAREAAEAAAPEEGPRQADQAPASAGCEGKEEEEAEEPAAAADDEEDEQGEKEEEDDKESKPADLGSNGGGGGGGAPDHGKIVRLAAEVQNRPKRKYYKISLIFIIDIAAKFRESILSWSYYRNKITRRIEEFVESMAAAH